MSSIPQQLPETSLPSAHAPAYTLFDAQSVALATFFGTPAAGATLMAVNDKRLGKMGRGIGVLVLSILATVAIVAAGWKLSSTVTTPIALALIFAMQFLAKGLQGNALQEHVARGGKLASKWAAFGVGMAYFAVIFAVVFVAVFLPYYRTEHAKVVIGTKDEVYYSDAATQADATELGKALKTYGYFQDAGVTVMLDKAPTATILSFVVKEGIWDKPEMVATFDEMGREMAPKVGGFPITVRLLNKNRDLKNETTVGKVTANSDDVYYFGAATQAQGQALFDALKKDGFFEGKGSDVFLSKQSDGTSLSFVVGDGVWDDAATVGSFEKIVRDVAPSVGGLPVRLRLESTNLDVKKELVVSQ
jgi:hypothetical protein